MEQCGVLSEIPLEILQQNLRDSQTWAEFKRKCDLPNGRRQMPIRSFLDEKGLDYSHLPTKGSNAMQQKSVVW